MAGPHKAAESVPVCMGMRKVPAHNGLPVVLCTAPLRQASRVQNEGLSIRHSDRSAAACLLVWRACGFTYGPVKTAAATSVQSFPAPRRQASTRLDKTARRQRADAAPVVLCVRALPPLSRRAAIGIKKARRPVPERHDSARASRRREAVKCHCPARWRCLGLLHLDGWPQRRG